MLAITSKLIHNFHRCLLSGSWRKKTNMWLAPLQRSAVWSLNPRWQKSIWKSHHSGSVQVLLRLTQIVFLSTLCWFTACYPFWRFLHDIVMEVTKKTTFGQGLFSPEECDSGNLSDKQAKLDFLNKAISVTCFALGEQIDVSAPWFWNESETSWGKLI